VTNFLTALTAFFDRPLNGRSRLLILMAAVCLGAAFLFPLWRIQLFSNQFPDGLMLEIFATRLQGDDGGNDLNEINVLNHYIGMRPLEPQNFPEMKWIPFALGLFVLLCLRAALLGKMKELVDQFVLLAYFGLFSMVAFYYRLYSYGHELSPDAAIDVPPFTPPLVGKGVLANFTVYSLPGPAAGLLTAAALGLALAVFLSRRERCAPASGARSRTQSGPVLLAVE
jgi:copper chaperone NosL